MPNTFDPRTFSQMQAGMPYASYKKTILGKVFVNVLDPFSGNPVGLLLEGTKGTDTEVIDVWNEVEDLFFRRSNKKALETGTVIKIKREEKVEPKTIEQYSDDELKEVINQRYAAFQKSLSAITSEAVLYRMQLLAEEMDKSERFIGSIKAKLADVQRQPANLAEK